MLVADTDVLIDFLDGRDPGAARVAFELERGQLATTALARLELLAAARGPRQRRLLAELLAAMPCLPLDAAAADRAAELQHLSAGPRGTRLGHGEAATAAIAIAHRASLLTGHPARFERIPGLVLARL